jgi:vacuolar protein sorting-associated protein 45
MSVINQQPFNIYALSFVSPLRPCTSTLVNLHKGKMKESDYPYVSAAQRSGSRDTKPKDILVFIIGGVTYEEARFVAQLNESGQGGHITLGGTTILNSGDFLRDLTAALCM